MGILQLSSVSKNKQKRGRSEEPGKRYVHHNRLFWAGQAIFNHRRQREADATAASTDREIEVQVLEECVHFWECRNNA